MGSITKEKAKEAADEFLAKRTLPQDYTLEFDSISEYKGDFLIKYNKVFKEPTKENPPYILVIVDATGRAVLGNP